jgi:hypothetical protein
MRPPCAPARPGRGNGDREPPILWNIYGKYSLLVKIWTRALPRERPCPVPTGVWFLTTHPQRRVAGPVLHSAQSRQHTPSVCFRNVSYSQFCGSWIDGHEMGAKWVAHCSGTGAAATDPKPEGHPS